MPEASNISTLTIGLESVQGCIKHLRKHEGSSDRSNILSISSVLKIMVISQQDELCTV